MAFCRHFIILTLIIEFVSSQFQVIKLNSTASAPEVNNTTTLKNVDVINSSTENLVINGTNKQKKMDLRKEETNKEQNLEPQNDLQKDPTAQQELETRIVQKDDNEQQDIELINVQPNEPNDQVVDQQETKPRSVVLDENTDQQEMEPSNFAQDTAASEQEKGTRDVALNINQQEMETKNVALDENADEQDMEPKSSALDEAADQQEIESGDVGADENTHQHHMDLNYTLEEDAYGETEGIKHALPKADADSDIVSSGSEQFDPLYFHPDVLSKPQEKTSLNWPMGVVPYYINKTIYDDETINRLSEVMELIESSSCIVFEEIEHVFGHQRNAWLHITNPTNERECVHDTPGYPYDEILVVIGFDCMRAEEMLHTLLHAIGLQDEVTHPHRDQYIRILWENIQPKYRPLFAIRHSDPPHELAEYDPASIMHFHDRAFSANGAATIAALIPGLAITPSRTLSQLDVMKLQLAFGHGCKRRQVDGLFEKCKNVLPDERASDDRSEEESEDSGNDDTDQTHTEDDVENERNDVEINVEKDDHHEEETDSNHEKYTDDQTNEENKYESMEERRRSRHRFARSGKRG